MIRDNILKQLQQDLTPFIDRVILVGGVANAAAGLLLFVTGGPAVFCYIDIIIAVALLSIFFLRKRVSIDFKIYLVLVTVLFHSTVSFIKSGLAGTGLIILMLMQAVTLVFLNQFIARIVAVGTVIILMTFTFLVHFDILYYDDVVLERMNSSVHWIVTSIGAIVFLVVINAMIGFLKEGLVRTIGNLEDTNESLRHSNRELQKSRETIERIAFTDSLTGLPNRVMFEKEVQRRIDEGVESAYLILINMKGFRVLNSLYGTDYGDTVLKAMGELFHNYQSETNIIARLNSDEFAGWAEDWNEDMLQARILQFSQDFKTKSENINEGTRIDFYSGIVSYPRDGSSFEECFRRAGMALRQAKDSQTQRLVQFQPSMLDDIQTELHMSRLLEKAIENQDFTICYQNKVNIHDGTVVGAEALARWYSEELGQVSPEIFIPVLSRSKLMVPFARSVFELILREFPALQKKIGEDISVSINISPLFFLQQGFTEYVVSMIQKNGINPSQITLEITEDIFIEDFELIQDIIAALLREGLNISLDDFGKGFSSLYYISNIQFTELKVDKSFIDNICDDEKSFGLFNEICNIASIMGYHVVAEGVETENQVAKLLTTSCEVVQGYYFSRPEPL